MNLHPEIARHLIRHRQQAAERAAEQARQVREAQDPPEYEPPDDPEAQACEIG